MVLYIVLSEALLVLSVKREGNSQPLVKHSTYSFQYASTLVSLERLIRSITSLAHFRFIDIKPSKANRCKGSYIALLETLDT